MLSSNNILKNNEKAILSLRSLYKSYGYLQYKMSKFEEYDFYARNKDFLISENIITFTDIGGKLLALKPDVTLSIVKNTKLSKGEVSKVYYNENVYRVQKATGSFKELEQTGLECIGDIDDVCVSEVLSLAVKSLDAISKDYVLEVSDQSIVLRAIELLNVDSKNYPTLLKLIEQKNIDGVISLCTEQNADQRAVDILKTVITSYGKPEKVIEEIKNVNYDNELFVLLENLLKTLNAVKNENIRIDFSAIGDVNYYNSIVFKGFINGIPTSVLTGGRYDPLIKKMGMAFGGIGFAVYLDLLSELEKEPEKFDVDAVVLYSDDVDINLLNDQLIKLRLSGKSVMSAKQLPKRLKYKELYKILNKGVELIENNA